MEKTAQTETISAERIGRVNLDALQSFAVFSESMNFSTAAQALHISQPALHVKIRKLSEQLALPLYRRHGRKLELTMHGQAVAFYGRELLLRTRHFIRTLHNRNDDQPVTMAAGEGAYLYLLGPAIQRFTGSSATLLKLISTDRDGALEAVRSGRAQIAVAPLETVPAGFATQPLATVGQVLVMPKSHPLAGRKTLKLKDLAGSRIVVSPAGRPHREMLARMLQSCRVDWDVAVGASGWELMIQFVRIGVGVAVVNAYCTIPKGLVALPLPELPALKFHLFHLRGQAMDGELGRLKNLLIAQGDAWKK